MSELIRREDAINAVEMFFEDAYIEDAEVHDLVYKINHIPAASPWHRVKEPPKKNGKYAVCWTYQKKIYWDWLIFRDGNWELKAGLPLPDYWMPIEPPKEDEHGN